MRKVARVVTSSLTFALVLASSARAQSAADVINRMLEAYQSRTAGVQNYTVVQEVMGTETVMYFEKEMTNGRPVFHLRSTVVGGMAMPATESDEGDWEEFYSLVPQMVEHARYNGRDQVNGTEVHVITVSNLDEIDFGAQATEEDDDFRPQTGTFFVDTDDMVVQRLVIEGELTSEGKTHAVASTSDFTDYREVDGMLHPFLITTRVKGWDEAAGMDDAKRAEIREQMAEMKRQMEQMPEAQRKMMEQMVAKQIEAMEQMMASEGGEMTVEIRVKELRVNSGPPSGS
jgi:hypothetical protein